MSNKIGAPKGGFVHWLVLSLPADLKKARLIVSTTLIIHYLKGEVKA